MLYRGARVLIMDEPTAVLAPQEAEELFRTLRDMTARGESIVFISHKLDEVLAIADRITVLRRGKVTAAGLPAAGATKRELARLMVGREVLEIDRAGRRSSRVRSSSSVRGVSAVRRPRPAGAARRLARRARRARSWASPAWRATARASWPRSSRASARCTGQIEVERQRCGQPPAREAIDARASRTCPRTAPAPAARPTSRSPTT